MFRYMTTSIRYEYDFANENHDRARVIGIVQAFDASPLSTTPAELQEMLQKINVSGAIVLPNLRDHRMEGLIVFDGGAIQIKLHAPILDLGANFWLSSWLEPLKMMAFSCVECVDCCEIKGKYILNFSEKGFFFDGDIFPSFEKAKENVLIQVANEEFESHAESEASRREEEMAHGNDRDCEV
jgi:hypothetical protein